MRREDRRLPQNLAEEILSNGEYGVLATVSADGQPYGVPLSYAYKDGVIYIHGTNEGGLKTENLKANARASFTVVGSTELMPEKFGTKYTSVICFGKVEMIDERDDKREGIEAIMMRYSSDYATAGMKYIESKIDNLTIYKFKITEISGKGRLK